VLSKGVLEEWHMGPRNEPNGRVVYLGKTYEGRETLPNDYINGQLISYLHGRGWDRIGYRDLIHRDGSIENLTNFIDDDVITNNEMTWGAAGFNSRSVHICLEGGRLSKPQTQPPMKGAEVLLYPPEQLESLKNFILYELANHSTIKVAGHYMLTNLKNCPNFDVYEYLRKIGRANYSYKINP
jgi:hypothetical protein